MHLRGSPCPHGQSGGCGTGRGSGIQPRVAAPGVGLYSVRPLAGEARVSVLPPQSSSG